MFMSMNSSRLNNEKDMAGYWSVHIDKKNRLVFCIKDNILEIVECGSHYGDH